MNQIPTGRLKYDGFAWYEAEVMTAKVGERTLVTEFSVLATGRGHAIALIQAANELGDEPERGDVRVTILRMKKLGTARGYFMMVDQTGGIDWSVNAMLDPSLNV